MTATLSQHVKLDERDHMEKPLLDQLSGLGWEARRGRGESISSSATASSAGPRGNGTRQRLTPFRTATANLRAPSPPRAETVIPGRNSSRFNWEPTISLLG